MRPRVPGMRTSHGVITAGPKVKYNRVDRLSAAEEAAKRERRHLWVMTGAWEVSESAIVAARNGETTHLDLENLLDVNGPGCFVCEQIYSAELAGRPCPGQPS